MFKIFLAKKDRKVPPGPLWSWWYFLSHYECCYSECFHNVRHCLCRLNVPIRSARYLHRLRRCSNATPVRSWSRPYSWRGGSDLTRSGATTTTPTARPTSRTSRAAPRPSARIMTGGCRNVLPGWLMAAKCVKKIKVNFTVYMRPLCYARVSRKIKYDRNLGV